MDDRTAEPARGTEADLGPAAQNHRQLDLLKALGDNTRYAIYLELARSAKPLTTADIAESLALHPNTVRPHLERMRDIGLLDVAVGGRGDVGRPQHRYSIAADAPSLGLEPPTMPMLARMVLHMAQRLNASADDAVAVGETEGASRAAPLPTRPVDARGAGVRPRSARLRSVVTDVAGDDDAAVVAFANCPFVRTGRRSIRISCAGCTVG